MVKDQNLHKYKAKESHRVYPQESLEMPTYITKPRKQTETQVCSRKQQTLNADSTEGSTILPAGSLQCTAYQISSISFMHVTRLALKFF